MITFSRSVIDSILPHGSVWRVAPDEDWDKLYKGIADNWEATREFLSALDCIRDPSCTTFLADLEQEFGVFSNPTLTEQQRRDQLHPLVYSRSSNGSIDAMQSALDAAGYNVQVHENSPAVDPAIFLDQDFQMVADGAAAFAGNQDAFAGRVGGELLVNGDLFKTARIYESVAGTMYADTGFAGEYTDLERTLVEYPIPADEDDWPLVFFVGGDATRDGSGALTDIESASVPTELKSEFKRLILRLKPMHSWAGLIITYS